ncbi:reverse transcriptase [Tanacetum coccineum]
MRKIISPQQSAFIPGRQIQDSIVVANEAFHYIRNKKHGKQNVMALKVDLNKAFDRVEWDFLLAVLRKMGFGDLWCNWICACLTTYELEFMVNGDYVGVIKPQRGLRQGDPVSPYLFIIIANVLSRQISRAMTLGTLSGIKMVRNCPLISHIFFADDSLFFLKASHSECGTLVSILNSYCEASCQTVNFQKSSAFFSPNTPSSLHDDICGDLHVHQMDPKAKYLGWKQKLLSQSGREVLIKGGDSDEHHIHWKNWKKLSQSKHQGGLGFRDFEAFNMALLAKQGWRLLINPDAFWGRILKGIYFPNSNFLVAKKGSHPSWIWSSLLHDRDLLLQGQYTIKSGYKQAIALISTSVSIGESSANPSSKFWKVIWHIPVQPKIKLFLWKAISNSVATKENLFRRNCSPSQNSSAAFGIVARDCAGLLRYVIGNRCRAVSPLHAEIIAVHFACSLVFNHGWFNAIVESDSQIAISLSSLDTSSPWSLAALVEDIRIWAENMQIRFSWVNRESNQVAHWVAHHAFSSTLGFSWDVSFPDELTSLSRNEEKDARNDMILLSRLSKWGKMRAVDAPKIYRKAPKIVNVKVSSRLIHQPR